MLPSIDLNNEAMFEADEIDDEGPDWMLAAKPHPCRAAGTQMKPKPALRIG